jgi:hypothetical protein
LSPKCGHSGGHGKGGSSAGIILAEGTANNYKISAFGIFVTVVSSLAVFIMLVACCGGWFAKRRGEVKKEEQEESAK